VRRNYLSLIYCYWRMYLYHLITIFFYHISVLNWLCELNLELCMWVGTVWVTILFLEHASLPPDNHILLLHSGAELAVWIILELSMWVSVQCGCVGFVLGLAWARYFELALGLWNRYRWHPLWVCSDWIPFKLGLGPALQSCQARTRSLLLLVATTFLMILCLVYW